ncbi:hypothetical protein SASPL_146843 [Salvia splendens]|uniref:Glutaredoxin domain-containing protein n=1 Tax=Salvia splendens TaxID=180675 RepID=A0A8X8WED4_SALSN|nr:uncharacterized protein At3g28850-like [Salvia splendens]KAG6392619.1 hypothetical protein SASPL_146843 [Salvia splendens]
MGCVSSKLVSKQIQEERKSLRNADYAHHVVSLTSTTYGALSLDKAKVQNPVAEEKECAAEAARKSSSSPLREDPAEIINAWELMEGLEEEIAIAVQSKKSPKSKLFRDSMSPMKFLASPRKAKKAAGKENKGIRSTESSPKPILKESNANNNHSVKKPSPKLWASIKKCDSTRFDSGVVASSRRRSLGPLFDPELVASLEREVSEEEEEMMIKNKNKATSGNSNTLLESYKKKCPPGGENAVVIYTTTLRGIRKTFEECNVARSTIESRNVEVIERDVSMHSAFKEEVRVLMGSKEVRVPLVFVKGRLIGGAEEMVRLDEEGKLGILLEGIPEAAEAGCWRCGGVRFVMCVECSGSCRVVGEDRRKSVKCGKCNENGLIQCPKCV